MTDSSTQQTTSTLQHIDVPDSFIRSIQQILDKNSIMWVFFVVLGLLALAWSFFGKRGYKIIHRIQGFISGALLGWVGGYIIEKIADGSKISETQIWESFQSQITLGALIGAVVLTVTLTLLGAFIARVYFFLMGGIVILLVNNAIESVSLLSLPEVNMLLAGISIVTGILFLWGSYKKPAYVFGIWGGVILYVAIIIPVLHVFSWFGGPEWLPFVTATGVSIVFTIAGVAIQLDYKEEVIKPMIMKK